MSDDRSHSSLNDQITDCVSQIQHSVVDVGESFGKAAAYQMMAHSIGLAMMNAVFNQQQTHILKQAVTTAAVKSILKSKPEEAVEIADKLLSEQDLLSTFSSLKEMMDDVLENMGKISETAEQKNSVPRHAKTKARTKQKKSHK